MAEIDQHVVRIHAFDELAAELAEARVAGLEAAVADEIAPVVGELDDAHAEPAERIEPIEIFAERRGVLETVDDREASAALGDGEIARVVEFHQHIGMWRDLAVPLRDLLDRCCRSRARSCRRAPTVRLTAVTPDARTSARSAASSALAGLVRVAGTAERVDDGQLRT